MVKTGPGAAKLRILHVEDDEAQAMLIRRMLMKFPDISALVQRSPDLTDALDVLHAQSFDVCLLDLGLPDADGVEAVKAVRKAAPDLRIIVVTGVGDPWAALAAIKSGAQDFLIKDALHPEALWRAILVATHARPEPTQVSVHEALLRALPAGVVLVRGDGLMAYSNPVGLELLRANDGLDGLRLTLPHTTGGYTSTTMVGGSGRRHQALIRSRTLMTGEGEAELLLIHLLPNRRQIEPAA